MVAAWTGYAKGKVESALVLIALSFVLAVFMVPFWMWGIGRCLCQHPSGDDIQQNGDCGGAAPGRRLITRKHLVKRFGIKTYKERIAPVFPGISTCGMLPMIFIIIASQARFLVANYQWGLLVILGIGTLYPIIIFLSLLSAKVLRLGYGNGMALVYSSAAKNHAITLGSPQQPSAAPWRRFRRQWPPSFRCPSCFWCLRFPAGSGRCWRQGKQRRRKVHGPYRLNRFYEGF